MLDLKQLVGQNDEALGKHDIAVVNLACAAGLPGADHVSDAGYRGRSSKHTTVHLHPVPILRP